MNRQTVMEIDCEAFRSNIEKVKEYMGPNKQICPVIKANGYGTYINKNLNLIKDFKIVAVALVKEAIELRQIGFTNDILVINQPCLEDIPNIIKYDITVGVSYFSFIEALNNEGHAKIHLELETGMGRTGFFINDLTQCLPQIANLKNITVEGVYTHLSSADNEQIDDDEYTKKQIKLMEEGVNVVKTFFPNLTYIHAEASNGLLNYQIPFCNLVRTGLIMYGYPSSRAFSKLSLQPIAKLKSEISYIKKVDKDFFISYGHTYKTTQKATIATIPIGYADGIRRILATDGHVIINHHKCPIVGRICMDSFMVDTTGIDAQIGDVVYLWDNSLITLEEVASSCQTINYEILATISNRVIRKFINE